MLGYIKKLTRNVSRRQNASGCAEANGTPISKNLKTNVKTIKELFCSDNDVVLREFTIAAGGGIKAAVMYIDGLAGAKAVFDGVLNPLMIESRKLSEIIEIKSIDDIIDKLLTSGEVGTGSTVEKLCSAMLDGDSVLLADGFDEFAYVNSRDFEMRSVSEPQTETVVRGPREGFTEAIRVNTSLLRRKIKSHHLRMDVLTIGERTKTLVCISYLDNLANPKIISEVRRRLRNISTDAILSSGYIEEYIEDTPYSVFPTINYTEKPDVAAAQLLEGRCVIIIDGTPFVLTLPMLFIECFQSPEDYTVRYVYATFMRILRIISFMISLVAPAMYIALVTFHQELIPTPLLFTIAVAEEGLPFPSFVETAIMLLTFEIMREAGVRLPNPVGQTVSIVGALVMGQAAIEAGIVGAPVVIVIAFTAVASFLTPALSDTTAILRWFFLVLAAMLGGFGIAVGLMVTFIHLASLESFGVTYLYPFAPFAPSGLKDAIVRSRIWKLRERPAALRPQDKIRQGDSREYEKRARE